jgi:benzoyl-CoA reductase subunit B
MNVPAKPDSPLRVKAVDAVRAYQRDWLAATRDGALTGEPFAISTSDECEEIFSVLSIPVLVINYWNFVITSQGKAKHFERVLEQRDYVGPHFFGLGLATTLEPQQAPWGGLPKPAIIVGATRHESELRVTEIWAREFGCPYFPLDFNFASAWKLIPPDDWYLRLRDEWPTLTDPARLDLRVEQLKSLIAYVEQLTGRTFSWHQLTEAMLLLNEQMDVWQEANDLIAEAEICPVNLRDQVAMYQAIWHRGTRRGLDFVKAYRDEVRDRVGRRQGGYADQRIKLLYWSMQPEPGFHRWLEQSYGAVFVGGPYSDSSRLYARTIHDDDPLRALAARHLFLFFMTPSWMIHVAKWFGVDGIVGIEPPAKYPSMDRRAADAAGIPYVAVPRMTEDDEVKSVLAEFIEQRVKR